MRTIINYVNFGKIELNLDRLMLEKGITISKMSKCTGLHHNIIHRYCNKEAIRFDADVLAKFCYVLECDITDILKYVADEN